jgi:hypothetical protein
MDKELISGAMDEHCKRVSCAFSEWCASNYMREFEPLDSSIPIQHRKYRQFWIDNDQHEYSTEDLYNLFIKKQLQISNNNTLIP